MLKAGEDVPPKVELRLARLYKAAFTRQQQRHLGLLGPEPPPRRARGKNIPKRHAAIGEDDADNYTTVVSVGWLFFHSAKESENKKIGKGLQLIYA